MCDLFFALSGLLPGHHITKMFVHNNVVLSYTAIICCITYSPTLSLDKVFKLFALSKIMEVAHLMFTLVFHLAVLKEPREMTIIMSTINTPVNIQILFSFYQ